MKIYQLNDHIPRIHQGKQTRCNNCQKKFSSEEFLQIHQKKYCHQQLQYNNTTGICQYHFNYQLIYLYIQM